MKYIIKFFDGKSIIVDEMNGKKFIEAKLRKITNLYNGCPYDDKSIAYIEEFKDKQEENLLPKRLENPVKKETLIKLKKELTKKFNWPT